LPYKLKKNTVTPFIKILASMSTYFYIVLLTLLATLYASKPKSFAVSEFEPCPKDYYKIASVIGPDVTHICQKDISFCIAYDPRNGNCTKCRKTLFFGLTAHEDALTDCTLHWWIWILVAVFGTLVVGSVIYIFCHLTDIRKQNKERARLDEEEARLRAAGEWVSQAGDEDEEKLNSGDLEPKTTNAKPEILQADDVESNSVHVEDPKLQSSSLPLAEYKPKLD
jgi:hypothetical protein